MIDLNNKNTVMMARDDSRDLKGFRIYLMSCLQG